MYIYTTGHINIPESFVITQKLLDEMCSHLQHVNYVYIFMEF